MGLLKAPSRLGDGVWSFLGMGRVCEHIRPRSASVSNQRREWQPTEMSWGQTTKMSWGQSFSFQPVAWLEARWRVLRPSSALCRPRSLGLDAPLFEGWRVAVRYVRRLRQRVDGTIIPRACDVRTSQARAACSTTRHGRRGPRCVCEAHAGVPGTSHDACCLLVCGSSAASSHPGGLRLR